MLAGLTIKAKQGILLGGFVLSLIILIGISLIKLGGIQTAFRQYDRIGVEIETNMLRIGKEVNFVSRATRSIMLGDDYDKNMRQLGESIGAIDDYFGKVKHAAEQIPDNAIRKSFLVLIDEAQADTRAFLEDGKKRMETLGGTERGLRAGAWSGYHEAATPLANKSRESFKKLSEMSADFMKRTESEANLAIDKLLTMLPIAAVLTIVITAWLGYIVVRDLLRQLGGEPAQALAMVHSIAAGNLTSTIELRPDDQTSLLAAFKSMQEQLRETIRRVSLSATELHQEHASLKAVVAEVAATSQSQSKAAGVMATAMGSMANSIRQVTASANDTWTVAQNAGNLSSESGDIVIDANKEMSKIAETVNRSSQMVAVLGKHSEMISTVANSIREIADQTNLLALNAAIEAARAGEQGRGFAVVADEVRKLAERTTLATQEIGNMIANIISGTTNAVSSMNETTERVARGVAMIDRAGESMRRIREGSLQVIDSVSQINAALKEQGDASTQAMTNVENIANMASTNHNATQEIAKTSEHLARLADSLQAGFAQFHI